MKIIKSCQRFLWYKPVKWTNKFDCISVKFSFLVENKFCLKKFSASYPFCFRPEIYVKVLIIWKKPIFRNHDQFMRIIENILTDFGNAINIFFKDLISNWIWFIFLINWWNSRSNRFNVQVKTLKRFTISI